MNCHDTDMEIGSQIGLVDSHSGCGTHTYTHTFLGGGNSECDIDGVDPLTTSDIEFQACGRAYYLTWL
jgi:hypothetical protein